MHRDRTNLVDELAEALRGLDDPTFDAACQMATELAPLRPKQVVGYPRLCRFGADDELNASRGNSGSSVCTGNRPFAVGEKVLPLMANTGYDVGKVLAYVGDECLLVGWYLAVGVEQIAVESVVSVQEFLLAVDRASARRSQARTTIATRSAIGTEALGASQGIPTTKRRPTQRSQWASVAQSLRQVAGGLRLMAEGMFRMTVGALIGLGQDLVALASRATNR